LSITVDLDLMKLVAGITKRAGAEILTIYATDFDVEIKGDDSPVTLADKAAEAIILPALETELPVNFPIVSEEAAADGHIPDFTGTPFWLVDPLDGTKEFISRNGDFTVNIGLIENGTPILGAVYAPAHDTTYIGGAPGAFMDIKGGGYEPIACRAFPDAGLTALVSRSHRSPETDAYLERFTIADDIAAGSSLKFCRVAEGVADLYPRLGRTMEWDTAAAHGVLKFAGGHVETLDGVDLTYGKDGLDNPHFVAFGDGRLPSA
jgi:3'(2'), 5'-bisphosphate nucleotidase